MPEVENVVRNIRPFIWGCNITGFVYNDNGKPPKVEPDRVKGCKIHHIGRLGKYIIFKIDGGYLISHLRMTGQWYFSSRDEPIPTKDKHLRWFMTVEREDGTYAGCAWFKDPRKFGTLVWVKSLSDYKPFQEIGPDGLDLDQPKSILKVVNKASKSKRPIKNLLLDQKVIAGCGNIYASDVLFEAKISPFEKSENIPAENIEEICSLLQNIFKKSIELGGSSISDYTGGRYHDVLKVYGREGEPCDLCGNKIEKTKQSGRSTFYCASCQGVKEDEIY